MRRKNTIPFIEENSYLERIIVYNLNSLSIGCCHDASETVVSSSVFPNPQQEALTKMLFKFQQILSAVVLSSKYGFSYLATDYYYYFIYSLLLLLFFCGSILHYFLSGLL
jgi:hypothetical protein